MHFQIESFKPVAQKATSTVFSRGQKNEALCPCSHSATRERSLVMAGQQGGCILAAASPFKSSDHTLYH